MNKAKELLPVDDLIAIGDKVVNKLIARRAIPKREREDVRQEVLSKYYDKKDQIEAAFKGKASPSTYVSAVMYRMCCEVIRSEYKTWDHVQDAEPKESLSLSAGKRPFGHSDRTLIQNEARYLRKLLQLFDDEEFKFILFCKYFFDLPVNKQDFIAYCKTLEWTDYAYFFRSHDLTKKQDKFKQMALFHNQCENKKVGADAIRIWFYKRMDQVTSRLNGTFQRSNYNRESFQLLFEFTFQDN